ncbi:MAG: hypothetical protein ACLQDQ_18635 [Myxococcaceae bacterium]
MRERAQKELAAALASPVARAIFVAILATTALSLWEGRQGFTLWDEGFLWYGVQRVLAGEVPIRDFQAYDPGRYYFSAALMRLTGADGLMALRRTLLIPQGLALATVLSLLAAGDRKRAGFAALGVSAMTLGAWMIPRYRLFDLSVSIGLVCALTFLVRRPTRLSEFLAGLAVGLAACIGRNHGVYGLIASLGVLFYFSLNCQDWRALRQGCLFFLVGLIAGYLPLLLMLTSVQHFAPAFADSIKLLFEVKATNLPLPLPWPWRIRTLGVPLNESIESVLLGLFFVAMLLFGLAAALYVCAARLVEKPVQPLLVACAFVGLPYLHYTLSRADLSHVALGIFPMLIGILGIAMRAANPGRWLLLGLLCATSWGATIGRHPAWRCKTENACEWVALGGDQLQVDRGTASDISLLRRLATELAPGDRAFFVAPFWPGAYAVLNAKSPTWEIYTPWRKSDAFQRREIERLAAAEPEFAVIVTVLLDGRDDLQYRNTHPLIEQYIEDNFQRVNGMSQNRDLQIYRRQPK